MTRLKIFILCLIAIIIRNEFGAYSQERKPNVILIVADDFGYGDIAFYNEAGKIPTPNLDKLAQDGVAFTDAHSTSSVCAPSRYSIMTGNYPWRGARENGKWSGLNGSQILEGQNTLGKLFQSNNYSTAFYGKWNLGGRFRSKTSDGFSNTYSDADFSKGFYYGAKHFGFDDSFYLAEGIQKPPYIFISDDKAVSKESIQFLKKDAEGLDLIYPGMGTESWSTKNASPEILNKILSYLEDKQDDNFFLYFSALESHWPWEPVDELYGIKVKGETGISKRSDFVYQLDTSVGIIVDKLNELGIMDNTLIIFTSDNGATIYPTERRLGHESNYPLHSGKGTIYEGGNRVPLIFYAGSKYENLYSTLQANSLVSLTDLYETLRSMCKLEMSDEGAIDSHSFYNNELGVRAEMLYQANTIKEQTAYYGFRTKDYVLTMDDLYDPVELFNLSLSIDQTNSSSILNRSEEKDVVKKMTNNFDSIRGFIRSPMTNIRKAFPNPFDKFIIIGRYPEKREFSIVNLQGKVLLSGFVPKNTSFKIETDGLESGIYLLKITYRELETHLKLHKK